MQRAIVRKGLIAVLFAFIMVLAFMPQKVNADTSRIPPGAKLDGFVYSFDQTFLLEDKEYTLYQVQVNSETLEGLPTSINLEEYYNAAKQEQKEDEVDMNVSYADIRLYYTCVGQSDKEFYEDFYMVDFDVQATLSEAVNEEVTFEYEVKAIVDDYETEQGVIEDGIAATLADNKITVKKGSLASEQKKFVLIIRNEIWHELSEADYIEDMYLVREKENKYGIPRSTAEYGVLWAGEISNFIYSVVDANKLKEDSYLVVGFENFGGAEAFVKEVNTFISENKDLPKPEFKEKAKVIVDKLVIMNEKNETKVATFAHAKGVQTGDSNNMVLFVVLFVMAVAAAGAVALKRN